MIALLRRALTTLRQSESEEHDCTICHDLRAQNRLRIYDRSGETIYMARTRLFHRKCAKCDDARIAEPLCRFCYHLRLDHLSSNACHDRFDDLVFLELVLDPFRDLLDRKDCAFCQLLSAIVSPDGPFKESQRLLINSRVPSSPLPTPAIVSTLTCILLTRMA